MLRNGYAGGRAMGEEKKTLSGGAFLADVEEEAREQLAKALLVFRVDHGETIAANVAKSLADYLSIAWGGMPIYIPKDAKRRASMMLDEFTGDNHAELARKYGVSLQTVYRVIKTEQQARRLKQGNLLG